MQQKRAPSVGGRPGITLEQVERAAKELQKQRRHIGPINVRLELGTGSYSTIIRYLRLLGYSSDKRTK